MKKGEYIKFFYRCAVWLTSRMLTDGYSNSRL